ncbi:MAG: DUF1049 domain-containing protein [Nocardioides sp.]|nr:DUF1049 domain-containing protein [Nocardioides sp.]
MSTQSHEPTAGDHGGAGTDPTPTPTDTGSSRHEDPLRGSRTSGLWVAVIASIVVLVLLVVFIMQNTERVTVAFLPWEAELPQAAALLIAAAAGMLLAGIVGSMRILQLRRRVKREVKVNRKG